MAWLFGSSASRSTRAASSASRRSLDRDARELSRPARTAPQPARETRSEKATPRAGRSESAAKRDGDFSRASKTPPRKHRHVSEEHAECAVCFEALCDAPTAVFVSTEAGSATRRTCAHYHHLSCARSLRAREMRRCPVCRAPFDDALAVPDPRDDPGGWFAAVDANGDGKLSPPEVLEALKAHVPCDWRRLERDVLPSAQSQSRKLCESSRNPSDASAATRAKARGLFAAWDPDGDGFIELREMVAPGGLLEYVTRAFPRSRARKERTKANKGAARRGEGAKIEKKENDATSGRYETFRGERPGPGSVRRDIAPRPARARETPRRVVRALGRGRERDAGQAGGDSRAGQDAAVLGKRSVLDSCARAKGARSTSNAVRRRRRRLRRRFVRAAADGGGGGARGAARRRRHLAGVLRGRLRGRRPGRVPRAGRARGGHRGEHAGGPRPRPRAGGDARRRRVGKRVTSMRVSTRFEIRTFRCSRFLASGVVSGADAKRALNA